MNLQRDVHSIDRRGTRSAFGNILLPHSEPGFFLNRHPVGFPYGAFGSYCGL